MPLGSSQLCALHGIFHLIWRTPKESNLQPADLEAAALPTELPENMWLRRWYSKPLDRAYETGRYPESPQWDGSIHTKRVSANAPKRYCLIFKQRVREIFLAGLRKQRKIVCRNRENFLTCLRKQDLPGFAGYTNYPPPHLSFSYFSRCLPHLCTPYK